MHDQRIDPCPPEEETDYAVLRMLLHPELRTPMSVDEIVREIGDRVHAIDALARLHGSGLIHRCNEFAFATQAARRFQELYQ
jgi:predicted transcriptional regulator